MCARSHTHAPSTRATTCDCAEQTREPSVDSCTLQQCMLRRRSIAVQIVAYYGSVGVKRQCPMRCESIYRVKNRSKIYTRQRCLCAATARPHRTPPGAPGDPTCAAALHTRDTAHRHPSARAALQAPHPQHGLHRLNQSGAHPEMIQAGPIRAPTPAAPPDPPPKCTTHALGRAHARSNRLSAPPKTRYIQTGRAGSLSHPPLADTHRAALPVQCGARITRRLSSEPGHTPC